MAIPGAAAGAVFEGDAAGAGAAGAMITCCAVQGKATADTTSAETPTGFHDRKCGLKLLLMPGIAPASLYLSECTIVIADCRRRNRTAGVFGHGIDTSEIAYETPLREPEIYNRRVHPQGVFVKTRTRCFQGFIALLALMGGISVTAAESVIVQRDSQLLESPAAGTAVVAQLPQGTAGELLGRKGAWLNLKTAAGTGWVMSFNVRFGGGAAASGSSGSSGLGNLLAPKRTTTATIGIRGLEAEDLKSARVDAQQVRLLDQYAASRDEAEAAAQASGLGAVKVDYFNP
jgi:hypothetical protein